jgi:hypothetical protein
MLLLTTRRRNSATLIKSKSADMVSDFVDYSLIIAKARTGEPEPPLNFNGTPKN